VLQLLLLLLLSGGWAQLPDVAEDLRHVIESHIHACMLTSDNTIRCNEDAEERGCEQ
jgi:hypothetical protein